MGFADLHIHTTWSDGLMNPRMILNYLALLNIKYNETHGRNYLDVIAIADHDEIDGAYEARDYAAQYMPAIDVVIGQEVSTEVGHVLALAIETKIEPGHGAQWTIDAIHEQKGYAVAVHPYTPYFIFRYIPYMSNLRGVGDLIKELNFDAVETVNANLTELLANRRIKKENSNHKRLPELGCSDAHFTSAFQKAYTKFPGSSKEELLKAIEEGTTSAHGRVWTPVDLVRFFIDKVRQRRICKKKGISPHYL
ncbi:MAG: hypothetical protein GY765_40965 [bacterium]|nr:hypothetical protein [bacterium]